MAARSQIAVCILAGGKSRRFGGNKALADWDGQPLIAHVLSRIRSQTDGPVAINAADPHLFDDLGVPVLVDEAWLGAGPLAGIRSALLWAKKQRLHEVVTVGVDLPFLPADYLQTLGAQGAPTTVSSNGRCHPINGLWGVTHLSELETYLESGKRAAHGRTELCEAAVAVFALDSDRVDSFFNVNSVHDLKVAKALNRLTRQ